MTVLTKFATPRLLDNDLYEELKNKTGCDFFVLGPFEISDVERWEEPYRPKNYGFKAELINPKGPAKRIKANFQPSFSPSLSDDGSITKIFERANEESFPINKSKLWRIYLSQGGRGARDSIDFFKLPDQAIGIDARLLKAVRDATVEYIVLDSGSGWWIAEDKGQFNKLMLFRCATKEQYRAIIVAIIGSIFYENDDSKKSKLKAILRDESLQDVFVNLRKHISSNTEPLDELGMSKQEDGRRQFRSEYGGAIVAITFIVFLVLVFALGGK